MKLKPKLLHFEINPSRYKPICIFLDFTMFSVHILCCLLGLTPTTILKKELMNRGINMSKNKLLNKLTVGSIITYITAEPTEMQRHIQKLILGCIMHPHPQVVNLKFR